MELGLWLGREGRGVQGRGGVVQKSQAEVCTSRFTVTSTCEVAADKEVPKVSVRAALLALMIALSALICTRVYIEGVLVPANHTVVDL